RAPMGRVAMEYADYAVITNDNPRDEEPPAIIKEILKGHTDLTRRKVILDRRRAITYAIETAQAGDLILLAGKGHETYELVKGELHPFDERTIAIEALARRRLAREKRSEEIPHED
ncbi:MAG: glutamate ligase domain-containing protein, partial [Eubacteriales bacterium]